MLLTSYSRRQESQRKKKEPSKLAMAFLAGRGSVSDLPTGDLCFGAKRIHKWHPCNTNPGVKRANYRTRYLRAAFSARGTSPTRASCLTPLGPTVAKILARPQGGRRWSRGVEAQW